MIRRTTAGVALALLAGLAAACGSGGSSGGGSQSVSTTPTLNTNGCSKPPPLTRTIQQYPKAPPLTIAKTTYTARIVTNCGTIIIAMDARKTPQTVNSFFFLAKNGYFNNTPCHRLTTSGIYVLQCGDPTGTGERGPGYTIPDENLKGATYPAGTVAMANTGAPHSGGSQFFLVYANGSLAPSYTPFGKITAGLDVLTRIAKAGSTPPGDGKPVQPVEIESFAVTKD